MDNFWIGFLVGVTAGQLVAYALIRFEALDAIKLWSRRVRRRGVDLFWRGLEMLLNYLDGVFALKRAREAGDLGSPNLAGRAIRGQ